MKTRASTWLLILLFATAVGHLAWHTLVGPPIVPDYIVGGSTPALCAPGAEKGDGTPEEKSPVPFFGRAKQLYLRREVWLPRRPLHAWLQVVARDQVVVYVNGRHVAQRSQDGFNVAAVVDIAAHLGPGRNVIGIVSEQARIDTPPQVAIDGAYVLEDGEHRLQSDGLWRCQTHTERRGTWWFEPEFRDKHWPFAHVTDSYPTAKVTSPPRATTVDRRGRWITPPPLADSRAAIRREFDLADRPKQGWLRVVATASYSLAVNDVVIDRLENRLDTTTAPVAPVERRYDLTPMLRRGHNVIALLLTSPAGPPHVRIGGEADDLSGARCLLDSGEQWLGRGGLPVNWSALEARLQPAEAGTPTSWQPCAVDPGYLDIMPWEPGREIGSVTLPADVLLERATGEIGLILAIALVTWLACRLAVRVVGGGNAVYLALLPAALAIGVGCLAVFDPRVAAQDVYRRLWVFVAVGSVLVQWAGLALVAFVARRREKDHIQGSADEPEVARPHVPVWALGLLIALLVVGCWLRVRHLTAEPLDGDETQEYREAMGLLERGYPSFVIDADLPVRRLCTSELVTPGQALTALVTRNDRWVVRFPAMIVGVLSILVIFVAGRHMFGTVAGLTAAALYTFSPTCVQMSNFGRYPAQVQFFALLTVYLFWRIIEGPKKGTVPLSSRGQPPFSADPPVKRWAVWLTVVSFIAMYLSWEPSALLALGMILAALVQRRGRLRTLLAEPSVWLGMGIILSVIILQLSHRRLVQMQYQTYLIEHDEARVSLLPMWQYPGFDILYYVQGAAWTSDTLLPMLGLLGGLALTLTRRDRRPALALSIIFLVTCFVMICFLPVKAWRYCYYVSPLLILLSAAALTAAGRGLVRLGEGWGGVGRPAPSAGGVGRPAPSAWRPAASAGAYARGVAVVAGLVVVTVASGVTLQFPELTTFRGSGYTLEVLKFPDLYGPVEYLRTHLQEGDVVITSQPHIVDHLMQHAPDGSPRANWKCDYWIESKIFYVAVLDDRQEQPLHRRSGQILIHPTYPFTDSLDVVFARPGRIWFLVYKGMDAMQNDPEVASYLRQHMDVVYEDFSTEVLLRDSENRPASMRRANEEALRRARANFLP